MAKRVFIIHGWGSNPDSGWIPWLKKALMKKGFQVLTPAMPNTYRPKKEAWIKHIAKIIGNVDKQCYFVGHSLGCIAILRYFESLKREEEVGGCILIGGPLDNRGYYHELDSFYIKPIKWDAIKLHCKKFIAIYSNDDYYVPLYHAGVLKKRLNAELVIKHGMKHFSGSDGFTKLPIALESVLKLCKA